LAFDPTLTLNDGRSMPRLGLGVWQTPAGATADVVRAALEDGYRLIDTAAIYGNEAGVGEGVRRSGLPREAIFVTTKLWNDSHGYDRALRAFDASLGRLGLEYVDLYLIHWPAPGQNHYPEAWRALNRLRDEGRAKSIGVSNFSAAQIDRLIAESGVAPAVNQVELHPEFQQAALRAADAERGVVTQSWSPLGRGQALKSRAIASLAAKHGKTSAQVVLRWHLQLGLVAIPKSARLERIAQNFAVWDFELDASDMLAIAALDSRNGRRGPDPAAFG
jgi:2,5-diketo-D-gluconate reductase A